MKPGWIVAYDISRDRDRARVAARLLGQGVRLQRSVFEVAAPAAEVLLNDLTELIRPDLDVIQAFRQCESCASAQVGVGQTSPTLRTAWWIA